MKRQALATLLLFTSGWTWVAVMAAVRPPTGVDPHAMTVGCAEARCCSSRCYLDKDGVHHCLPKENASCTCGLSSRERDAGTLPVFHPGTLPTVDPVAADPLPVGETCSLQCLIRQADVVIPTPPPRMSLPA